MEDVTLEINKINQKITEIRGNITGANYRISQYQDKINELNKENEELRKFKNVVNVDYVNYKDIISQKKKYAESSNDIKNLRCSKVFSETMLDRLKGIRPSSTNALFFAILAALTSKIDANCSKITSLNGLITSEQIMIGDFDGAIRSYKTQINLLKQK